ncbi:hypothetical protein A3860_17690 [Niastella vici]|jgi:hypothetical protein|uniref:HTH cro/C1-type domain-containing protein n=1 Tax=Niastella vici TaxID=1703345 RepID=A0A1V9G4I4_9BACT|nr:hypothetical protein [Niastella vici]OQP65497.1 hypothetical protein A3860_17690 [Niastella vici]
MKQGKKAIDKNLERMKLTSDLLLKGEIKVFQSLFIYSNRTYVAQMLGMNYKRLGLLSKNPDSLRVREIIAIARLFKVPALVISEIILNQLEKNSIKSKK